MASLPPRPSRMSSPASPTMVSASLVPTRWSGPGVPSKLAARVVAGSASAAARAATPARERGPKIRACVIGLSPSCRRSIRWGSSANRPYGADPAASTRRSTLERKAGVSAKSTHPNRPHRASSLRRRRTGAASRSRMTVQALRERRIDTLAGLLDAYGREIQGVAYLILRDRALAEDVTIETLLTAFERGGSIRDDSALRPWLLRVATNKALSVRRSGARVVHLAVLPDSLHPGDLAADASDRVALLQAVGALPIQMRAAVVLRYYADLSVEGVA